MTPSRPRASTAHTVPDRILMVGFGQALLAHLDDRVAPRTVVIVEDPDVIERRSIHAQVRRVHCVAGVLPVGYHDYPGFADAVASQLNDRTVDLVIPALEYAVCGAAALAARWKLPGASTRAATCLTDKLRLREAAAAAGLRNPAWREVFGPADVADFADGAPVVLKPANRQASLGVQLLSHDDDLATAWVTTVAAEDDLLPSRGLQSRYIAEARIHGPEYSAEALVRGGEIVFLNVTDKRTALGRHPVELGHVVPANLSRGVQDEFSKAMNRLTRAVGFECGVLHAEWILDRDGLVLIECAGRLPGDSIVHLIDAAYGFDFARALLGILAGRAPRLPKAARRASAIRFLTARPGRVVAVEGVERARAARGVTRGAVSVTTGDEVGPLRSSWDRVGEVVTTGLTARAAERRAARAAALVRVATAGQAAPLPA